jgi:hypothetical protein
MTRTRRAARGPASLLLATGLLLGCEARPAGRRGDGAAPAPGPAPPAAARHRWLAVADVTRPRTSYEQAEASADRSSLGTAFRRAGYAPPARALLLTAEIGPGVGQPALRYWALGDTAFTPSAGRFELASTLKLAAIVAALWTLGRHGLDGDTLLRFTDPRGEFLGRARELYLAALSTNGSNQATSRLQRIAGYQAIGQEYFTPERGFPHLALQTSFDVTNVVVSPAVSFSLGQREGQIPERVDHQVHPTCPDGRHCGTLFETQDVLRRLVLHEALPEAERFPLQLHDVRRIREALARTPVRFGDAPARALGPDVRVASKTGYLAGAHLLENAFIEVPRTGRRLLLLVGVPLGDRPKDLLSAEAALAELTRQALLAITPASATAAPVQRDAGPSPVIDRRVQVEPGGHLRLGVTLPAGTSPEIWVNGHPAEIASRQGDRVELRFARPRDDRLTLVVRALRDGAPVAHAWRELRLAEAASR